MGLLVAATAWASEATLEHLLEAGHIKRLRDWAQPKVAGNTNVAPAAYYLGSAKEARAIWMEHSLWRRRRFRLMRMTRAITCWWPTSALSKRRRQESSRGWS